MDNIYGLNTGGIASLNEIFFITNWFNLKL